MYGQGSGVKGGWRQGQELEQDVVDSAISNRMLGNMCGQGEEVNLNTKTWYQ